MSGAAAKRISTRHAAAHLRAAVLTLALAAAVLVALVAAPARAELPPALDDAEFWRLVETLSEPEGRFAPQYMSNEDSLQFVMPELVARVRAGGAYVGVAAEQNFTYLAALRPAIAFIVDIRRDNLRQLLLYKALFELSPDRATFVAKLFSRVRPQRVDTQASVEALFAAFANASPDLVTFLSTRAAVLAQLDAVHGFALSEDDRAGIARILEVFRDAGPEGLKGFGDATNPTFAALMAATDLDGKAWGFLASERNYGIVRDLHVRNLVVPVVGDFTGDRALAGIGAWLDERDAVVRVFYLSNVERYLWEPGTQGAFYANAARLPHDADSLFVRSVTSDISIRLGIPIPDQPAKWRTFVTPMVEDLDGVQNGRIRSYRGLFMGQAPAPEPE